MDPIITSLSTWVGHKSKAYAVFSVSYDGERCIYTLEKTSTLDLFTPWPAIETTVETSNIPARNSEVSSPAQAAELLAKQRKTGALADTGNSLQRLHEITRRVLADRDEPVELYAAAQGLQQHLSSHFLAPLPLSQRTPKNRRAYRPRVTQTMRERRVQVQGMQAMTARFRNR